MHWSARRSAVSVLAVVLACLGLPLGGCANTEMEQEFSTQAARVEATSGPIFITGHDPDFHAQDDAGARRLLTKAVAYVRHGSSMPMLWVESRIATPGGHRVGKAGLRAIGLTEGPDFIHLDAAQLKSQSTSWWQSLGSRFSAIAVASDYGGTLTQAELDQLNAHREDIAQFVNTGGGLLALSEGGGGAGLTQREHFKFLPIEVSSTGNASPPYTVTTYGRDEFGLIDTDVNSPSHSHFASDFGLNVVTRSAPTGQIMTLAGKVRITSGGFLVANAGPDQTRDATAALTPVLLDGSGSSTDPGGAPLHYRWVEGGMTLAETDSATTTVQLPPGIHSITLVVTNNRGETASDDVVITLRNTLPPRITCPDDIQKPTDSGVCSAQVSFPPPVVDAPNGIASVSCDHTSASTFLGGISPVTCTVVDRVGNQASCSFTIAVKDQEPPMVEPPAPTTSEADALCQAGVPDTLSEMHALDNCTHDHDLVFVQTPPAGSTVSVGTHTLQIKVTDEAGNSTTVSTTHTVLDVTPPTLHGATPSQGTLWPPNHKMVPISVSVDVTDACGDGAVQCQLTSVTSNEPINGRGDGNTDWDWELTGPLTVNLRAERAGPLTGRVYTLGVVCTDAAGHTATTSTSVVVPHDQRGK